MKKSQLKEAIKAEIKSVLSEGMSDKEREDKLQQAKRGGGKEKPLRKLATTGKKADSLKEESRFPTQADIDDIENSGNIDIAYDKAMKLLKSLMNKSVAFSDIREGTWSSGTYNEIGRFIQDVKNLKDKYYNIVGNDDVFDGLDRAEESAREMMINAPENRSDLNEDEMSDEEKDKAASKGAKKKDSVATISNKLQKLTAKMKKKAKEFKEAEGKAKDKIKDELKDMTAEKKKLEKSL